MSQQLAIMTGFAMHYVLCAVWPKLPANVKMSLWELHNKKNKNKLYKNSTLH